MSTYGHRGVIFAAVSLVISATLTLMVACQAPNQPDNNGNHNISGTATTIQDPLSATKEALNRQDQQRLDQMRTADILSHVPTHPSGAPPTDTFGPSPTWEIGIMECSPPNGRGFAYVSCWRGMINNEIVSVTTGGVAQYGEGGRAPTGHYKAALMVLNGPYMPDAHIVVGAADNPDFYYVPIQAEIVKISSASGTRITLRAVNQSGTPTSEVLVFDVASRQFISPSGTPIVTTPVPTP